MSIVLSDIPCERAILAGICQYGSTAYYDIADMLQEHTFTDEIHRLIFRCLAQIIKSDDNAKIDIPSIQSVSHELGISYIFAKKEETQYLQALIDFPVMIRIVGNFDGKIRKLELAN